MARRMTEFGQLDLDIGFSLNFTPVVSFGSYTLPFSTYYLPEVSLFDLDLDGLNSSSIILDAAQIALGNVSGTTSAPPPVSTVLSGPFGAAFELSSLLAVNGGDGSSGFILNGTERGNISGRSVSSAGDINGDGFDDIIIGAVTGYPNGNGNGENYVVFGSNAGFGASLELSALNGSNGFVINGINEDDYSGSSATSAGDINGDGFDDIIIGADGADPNGNRSGESYVIFGRAAPFAASLGLSTLNGSNGFVINGIDTFDFSGSSLSSAGDINGDGFDDIIIASPLADPNGYSSGESYVIFGRNAGFGASLELSSLLSINGGDGSTGFVINGIAAFDHSGASVSSAGDINGDGLDDIIIGATGADPNGVSRAGESYVVFGRNTGFGPSLDLSTLLAVNGGDGSAGFVINGIDVEDNIGSVSSAGDINGDGFDDIIIGADSAESAVSNSGESYVIFGSDAGFGTSLNLSALDGSNGFVVNGTNASDFSGNSVSSAGDINGDGFDDIIIGAYGGDPNGFNSGESYVVFGRHAGFAASLDLSSLDGSNGFVINGIDERDNSGNSVSSAGDINGDGFDDIIIGAHRADPNGDWSGESYVIYGRANSAFELSSLLAANGGDGRAGFVINGIDAIDKSGTSVSSAGDINGDGFDDIIIGAYGGDSNGNSGAGESYVVFGGAVPIASLDLSTLDGSNGFVINGIDANDRSGISVSSAGDINDDGFDDLLIGASLADPNGFNSGESYVVFGSAAPTASLDLSTLNGTNGFVINGISGNDRSGFSVSSAGDINGDGIDDIIIGARLADPNGNSDAGESYVVFGSNAGFGASFELSSLNGTNGFVINGINGDDLSGIIVSSAGDINGDGFDDVIIGASFAGPNGLNSGESYVVFGSAAPAASLDLSTLNGTNGFVINGIDADDESGVSVSSAGDINGDGFDDIIIGAKFADPNGLNSGESYVLFGSNAGFAANLELSSLLAVNGGDGSIGFVITGIDVDDESGFSVSSAGDMNGDGFDDILIGANGADPNGLNSGESYIVFGSNAGFAASLDLSSLDGNNGFVINGIDANDRSGFSVSAAGDVNGDGFDDIIIGASLADPNGSASGESYVIYGRAGFGRTVQILAPTDDTYFAVGTGEVVYGLEGDDAITGTAGHDILYGDAGDDRLEGGAGNDVLDGGGGADVAIYIGNLPDYDIINNGDGSYTVTDNVNGNGIDTLTNIEIARFDDGDFDITTMMPISQFTEGDDVVDGTENDNVLDALGGNDTVNGLGGNDIIFGRAGNDILNGGDGDDAIDGGDGVDSLIGGEGADALSGGAGFDTADYRGAASGISFNVDMGGTFGEASGDSFSGIERYYLSNFNDVITGSDANEFFFGEDGNDTINAGGGIDRVYGGDGNDFQRGQEGNDVLYGSAGNDQLNGGAGFDIASYELAASRVELNLATGGTLGDAAGDTYFGIEVVRGSDFNDTLTGNNSANELRGGDGDDILNGEGGNDRLFGGAGADSFDGGAGIDIVNYTLAIAGVGVNLITGGFDNGGGPTEAIGDSYSSIEWVFGSSFDDTITGDAANNRLEGRDGSDSLFGGEGNDRLLGGDDADDLHGGDGIDTLFGQAGNDQLFGDGGNDFLFGSEGGDVMDGGADFDTVSYLASSSAVTINLTSGGTAGDAAGDTYVSIERVFGTSHDDSITGSADDNVLLGNGGSDYLAGGAGTDTLIGGAGTDSFGYNTVADGSDVINDFFGGETIYILGGDAAFDTFAEIQAVASDAGGNVIFNFGGGNTLTIVGRNIADLDAGDFDFGGMPPAGEPLSDPDAFAADIIDVFDMDALI